MTTLQNTIETILGKKVNFEASTDCANLLFTAKINGITVANVYKSYDSNYNLIEIIRYTNID